jgi:hypothetical protein
VRGRLPREQLQEQHAEAIDVGLLRHPSDVGDLGRAVAGDPGGGERGADERRSRGTAREAAGAGDPVVN